MLGRHADDLQSSQFCAVPPVKLADTAFRNAPPAEMRRNTKWDKELRLDE